MRYVLADELATACAELAYAGGHRLVRCLDLIRIPGPSVWVEWHDSAALLGAREFFGEAFNHAGHRQRRAGAMLLSTPSGQSGVMHTVWADADQEPLVAAVDVHLDFNQESARLEKVGDIFWGGWSAVTDSDPYVAKLLNCARYQFESSWGAYYRTMARSDAERSQVIRSSLSSVARDVPILMAFFLLLASNDALARRPVCREHLNRKRVRNGKDPLLDHVEASLSILATHSAQHVDQRTSNSRFRRHHHVRGHLVRRGSIIYWRRAHARGSYSAGAVKSRTVTLSFDSACVG
ncbi:MAG: hypothetical protein M3N91_17450 [Pseudomonadota bacterium]|nr:hypothetical protein [Pseudomonadota bacterium]